MPFLKEEKSEHERARTFMLAVQLCCARHCELPLSKMGNKGLFPGVAVPLAFFGTFFRTERKYYPSQGGSPTVRAVVGASCIRSGFPSGKVGVHRHRQVLPAHSLCRFGPYRKKFIFRNLNFLQNNYSPHHRALRRSST